MPTYAVIAEGFFEYTTMSEEFEPAGLPDIGFSWFGSAAVT